LKPEWWRIDDNQTIVTNSALEVFHRDLKSNFRRKPTLQDLQSELLRVDNAKVWFNRYSTYNEEHHMSKRRQMARQYKDQILENLERFVRDPYVKKVGMKSMSEAITPTVHTPIRNEEAEEEEEEDDASDKHFAEIIEDYLYEPLGNDLVTNN
jgi:hypothetical protein